MNFFIVSIFPEIFDSFLFTSLIKKAQEKWIINIEICNPRNFCFDKHKQVDDKVYWWWQGMLLKAQPIIDCVNSILTKIKDDFLIINLTPSKKIFNQKLAFEFSKKYKNIIIVCGRYEWIDYRFFEYFKQKYWDKIINLSIWQFVVMWWEIPAMILIEAISRLIPWVIKEKTSREEESYQPDFECKNIEFKQYTRPKIVEWLEVPEVLLSWNDAEIEKWKKENMDFI